MHAERPVKGGVWDIGAISNATFTGVRLRDVLMWYGVVDPYTHTHTHVTNEHTQQPQHQQQQRQQSSSQQSVWRVGFEARDGWERDGVSLSDALSEDTHIILAYEKDGEQISPGNG